MLSIREAREVADVHHPANFPELRSYPVISAVAAAVLALHAFQSVLAQPVQAIPSRSPALPQARSAPIPPVSHWSTLYIKVRHPAAPCGPAVAPSLLPEDHDRPPSKDRSSQTWSPGTAFSTEPHPMTSLSERWSARIRPWREVVTGVRSPAARRVSRVSQ